MKNYIDIREILDAVELVCNRGYPLSCRLPPAGAGEPAHAAGSHPSHWVYPHTLCSRNQLGFQERLHLPGRPSDLFAGQFVTAARLSKAGSRLPICATSERLPSLPCESSVPPAQLKRRYVALSMYHPLLLQALERNKTRDYHRERKRRQTIAERTFASLDRLGWARSRLRRLWKSLPPSSRGWTARGTWQDWPTMY